MPSQKSGFRCTHLGMSQALLWTGCLYCLGLYTILATHSAVLIEDRRLFPKVSHQSLRVLTPVLHLLTSCLALAYPRLPNTVPRLVPPTPFPPPPGCCSGQHLPRQASLDLCTLHPPTHTHTHSLQETAELRFLQLQQNFRHQSALLKFHFCSA